MEAILLRFPHLGYQIFDQLDNTVLTICREVNNSWNSFIDNEKLPWIRMIVQHIKPLASPWKKFLRKSNYESLVEIALSVLQYYKEFNCVPENTVPLHFAAMTGKTEIIKRLIQEGSQFNKIRGAGICEEAWQVTSREISDYYEGGVRPKLLSQHKKKKKFELEKTNWIPEMEIDSFQCTPLHYAARNGHLTAYQVIMEVSHIKNPECGYMTPFHMAAKHGHLGICKLIIDHVEDKNPKNVDDETPLHYAAKGGFLEICQLIIDNIEKVDDKNPGDESGNTPLHYAVTSGNLAIFKLIIYNTHYKNPPANDGITPLHLAAKYGKLEMFQRIFRSTSSQDRFKNPRDNYGYTPLHYAAENGHLAICQIIIAKVEDKNSRNIASFRGLTPLNLAARKGHYDICQLFLENIPELRTPSHQGYRNWRDEVCNIMMQYSGKSTKRNADGVSRTSKHREEFFGKFHFPKK